MTPLAYHGVECARCTRESDDGPVVFDTVGEYEDHAADEHGGCL